MPVHLPVFVQNDNLTDISLGSSRLDFMWRIGLFDLSDGLNDISIQASTSEYISPHIHS